MCLMKDQELKDELTYYVGFSGQFEGEEAIYEEDILQIQKNKELTRMTAQIYWMYLLVQLQKMIL